MIKHILVLMATCLTLLGCQPRLNNQFDREIMECGISQKELGNRKILRSKSPLNSGEFQIFDQNGEPVSDFEVTPKQCLILPEPSPAASVVLANGTAARIGSNTLEFRSCGQDCAVFPVCGYFENNPKYHGAWVYAHVKNLPQNLNAIFEADTGPQSIDISDNSCLRIDGSAKGTVRLSDSEGNFLDGSLQDMIQNSPRRKQLIEITLRNPLTEDEIFCKGNSDYYKLVEGKCLPKDIRDYCLEFQAQYGKLEIAKMFGTANCERIYFELSQRQEISFGRMRLQSAKFFSNLPHLKGLNLSGNPQLGSLKEMKGTDQIEELIIPRSNFDLSEVSLFPKLRSLTIGNLRNNWKDAPIYPQIKSLEIYRDDQFDPAIFEKFPELEELIISYTPIENSLDVLASLKKLKRLEVDLLVRRIPSLSSLESLKAYNMEAFYGQYPNLKTVVIKSPVNIKALAASELLETLIVRVNPGQRGLSETMKAYEELRQLTLPNLKTAEIDDLHDFFILSSIPNIENLHITISSITSFNVKTRFDLAPLRKMKNLKKLTIARDSHSEQALPLESVSWPNLKELEILGLCTFKDMDLPSLEKMVVHEIPSEGIDLTTTNLSSLKSLKIIRANQEDLRLPCFNRFSWPIRFKRI